MLLKETLEAWGGVLASRRSDPVEHVRGLWGCTLWAVGCPHRRDSNGAASEGVATFMADNIEEQS